MKSVKCEKCGAVCNVKDGYCPECWTKLPGAEEFEIEGIGEKEWADYIQSKSNRYIDIYKKNEGKKFFPHMNWSAFFFGVNWTLYRKMYKFSIIFNLLLSCLIVLTSVITVLPHTDRIEGLKADLAAYEEYIESGKPSIMYNSGGAYSPKVVKDGNKAYKELYGIVKEAALSGLGVMLLSMLFLGFFGDSIYKQHILKNINDKAKGGVSFGGMIGMKMLFSLCEEVIVIPLATLIFR